MNKKPLNNKKNIKTKIISVAAAVALWMYVIAVVDPEDRKVIEDIPIKSSQVQQTDIRRKRGGCLKINLRWPLFSF